MATQAPSVRTLAASSGAIATVVSDAAQPLVAMSIRIAAGASCDPPGRSGLAHVVEHLMFSGTARHMRGEHIRTVQAWGGFVNAKTSADWTKYYHAVTPDLFGDLLDMERERFAETPEMMSACALDDERAVVLNERSQRMDNVGYGQAVETVVRELCAPSTGYHRLPIGTVADVKATTAEDCCDFQARNYTGGRVKVAIAGQCDFPAMTGKVMALLEAFPASQSADAGGAPAASPALIRRRLTIEGPRKTKVYLGVRLPAERTWEFELARFASFYLSRGTSALLPDSLVRRQGVASAVAAKTMGREFGPSIGVIEIMPAQSGDCEHTIAAVDAVIARALACDLDSAALERTRAMYRSAWLTDDDSVIRRTDALSLSMQLTGTADAYFEHDAKIRSLTAADLKTGLEYWHQPGARIELLCAR